MSKFKIGERVAVYHVIEKIIHCGILPISKKFYATIIGISGDAVCVQKDNEDCFTQWVHEKQCGRLKPKEKESQLKPFNLEAALRGEPVVTRCGQKVEVIQKINRGNDFNNNWPLVCFLHYENGKDVCYWRESGKWEREDDFEHPNDLFMSPAQ